MNLFNQRSNTYFGSQSMFFHMAILLVFLGLTKWINYDRDQQVKESLQLIEASVRVDVVAMPEFTPKELRAMELDTRKGGEVEVKKEPVKEVPTENKSENTFNKTTKKLSFEERMKLLAKGKIEKVKKKPAKKQGTEQEVDNSMQNEFKKLLKKNKGNIANKGSSLYGSGKAAATAWTAYNQKLIEVVRPHWKLPSYLLGKNLNCRVRIYLAKNGRLISAKIHQSSGNDEYDKRALATVKRSSPFPKLAKAIRMRGSRGDIILGFPL